MTAGAYGYNINQLFSIDERNDNLIDDKLVISTKIKKPKDAILFTKRS